MKIDLPRVMCGYFSFISLAIMSTPPVVAFRKNIIPKEKPESTPPKIDERSKTILETGKKASELTKIINIYPQVLINAKVNSDKKMDYEKDEQIKAEIEKLEKEFSGNGRVLIRPSGTEPKVRVMIEGENLEYITKKAENLAKLIENKLK